MFSVQKERDLITKFLHEVLTKNKDIYTVWEEAIPFLLNHLFHLVRKGCLAGHFF